MSAKNSHTSCSICGSQTITPLRGYENKGLVKCGTCSFVFSEKIPTNQELQEHYKNYSYGSATYESPITKKRYNELLDKMEPYRKSNRLLDDGCGTGFFLITARERGWDVYGTEYSERAVYLCEQNGIKMIAGDLELDSFPEEHFDVITSFEVIEHLVYPNRKVDLFSRFLRPGGLLYCTTPNFNSISRRILKDRWSIIGYPEHLCYFTKKTLTRLLHSKGLRTTRTEATGISLSRIKNAYNKQEKIKGKESTDERFREAAESRKLLSVAKKIANGLLTFLNAGDTLKHWVRKV